MRACFTLFLLFGILNGLAAQGTSALARVDSLAQLGEYKNAIRSTEQFLSTKPRNFAKSLAYYRLSKAHYELGDLDLAWDYNKESLSIKERISYEYFADNMLLFGLIELARANPAAAMDYFRKAENLPHESILFSAQLERNIGAVFLQMDSLDAAERRFYNTIDLLLWEVGEVHPEVALTRIGLGRIQTIRGEFLEALKVFAFAQNMLKDSRNLTGEYGTQFYEAVLEWLYGHEKFDSNNSKIRLDHKKLKGSLFDDEALLIHLSNDLYECTFATTKDKAKVILEDKSRKMKSMDAKVAEYELISIPKDKYVERASALYKVFISPVSSVLDGAKRLTIVKANGVQNLEYRALLRRPASASENYEDFDFLGEHYLLTYENTLNDLFIRGLSETSNNSNVQFSEDFPKWYKWRVKWKFKRYLREGVSRVEALHKTRLWMMDHRKLAEPALWLGIS